jgi:hypothetical protein
MKEQFVAFMEKLFENGHAEEAPPVPENAECWCSENFLLTFMNGTLNFLQTS